MDDQTNSYQTKAVPGSASLTGSDANSLIELFLENRYSDASSILSSISISANSDIWLLKKILDFCTQRQKLPSAEILLNWLKSADSDPRLFALILKYTSDSYFTAVKTASYSIESVYEQLESSEKELKAYTGICLCAIYAYRSDEEGHHSAALRLFQDIHEIGISIDAVLLLRAARVIALARKHHVAKLGLELVRNVHIGQEVAGYFLKGEFYGLLGERVNSHEFYKKAASVSQGDGTYSLRARFSIGLLNLLNGSTSGNDLQSYELRAQFKQRYYPDIRIWGGEPECNIIVTPEQGVGDEIFFLRFMPILQGLYPSCRFFIQCSVGIKYLASQICGIRNIFSEGDSINVNVDSVMLAGSAPYWISRAGLDPASSARRIPRIRQELVDGKYGDQSRKKIGIVWRSAENPMSLIKSIGFSTAEKIAKALKKEYTVVSFQHDVTVAEQKYLDKMGVDSAGMYLGSLSSTPCIRHLEECTHFIGVACSMSHLAATIGVKTHVLVSLAHSSSYGWAVNKSGESIWYGSNVSVYKQRVRGEWDDPVHKAVRELLKCG